MTINNAYVYTCMHTLHRNSLQQYTQHQLQVRIWSVLSLQHHPTFHFASNTPRHVFFSSVFNFPLYTTLFQLTFFTVPHRNFSKLLLKSFLMMQKSLQSNEFENAYIHLINTISGWLAPSERCIYTQSLAGLRPKSKEQSIDTKAYCTNY